MRPAQAIEELHEKVRDGLGDLLDVLLYKMVAIPDDSGCGGSEHISKRAVIAVMEDAKDAINGGN